MRENLDCHAVATEASTDPSECSEARKTLQTWFKLKRWGHGFVLLHQSVFSCRPTQGEWRMWKGISFQPKSISYNNDEKMSASTLKGQPGGCATTYTIGIMGVLLCNKTMQPRIICKWELANFPSIHKYIPCLSLDAQYSEKYFYLVLSFFPLFIFPLASTSIWISVCFSTYFSITIWLPHMQ